MGNKPELSTKEIKMVNRINEGSLVLNSAQISLLRGLLDCDSKNNGYQYIKDIVTKGEYQDPHIANVWNYLRPLFDLGIVERRNHEAPDKKGNMRTKTQYRLKLSLLNYRYLIKLLRSNGIKHSLARTGYAKLIKAKFPNSPEEIHDHENQWQIAVLLMEKKLLEDQIVKINKQVEKLANKLKPTRRKRKRS